MSTEKLTVKLEAVDCASGEIEKTRKTFRRLVQAGYALYAVWDSRFSFMFLTRLPWDPYTLRHFWKLDFVCYAGAETNGLHIVKVGGLDAYLQIRDHRHLIKFIAPGHVEPCRCTIIAGGQDNGEL